MGGEEEEKDDDDDGDDDDDDDDDEDADEMRRRRRRRRNMRACDAHGVTKGVCMQMHAFTCEYTSAQIAGLHLYLHVLWHRHSPIVYRNCARSPMALMFCGSICSNTSATVTPSARYGYIALQRAHLLDAIVHVERRLVVAHVLVQRRERQHRVRVLSRRHRGVVSGGCTKIAAVRSCTVDDSTRHDRRAMERRGQERTGEDKRGQERTREDGRGEDRERTGHAAMHRTRGCSLRVTSSDATASGSMPSVSSD
jgi:hypothetical protein